jgi:hypothetical protein
MVTGKDVDTTGLNPSQKFIIKLIIVLTPIIGLAFAYLHFITPMVHSDRKDGNPCLAIEYYKQNRDKCAFNKEYEDYLKNEEDKGLIIDDPDIGRIEQRPCSGSDCPEVNYHRDSDGNVTLEKGVRNSE